MVVSVPMLFAIARGRRPGGDSRCYYCGAPCDDSRPVSVYVKSSFTGRGGVHSPSSPSVCEGCELCLKESTEIPLVDGSVHSGAVRTYSWVVTERSALAATKAHLEGLRALCLDPPPPPFAICLSDSGKKHLLYRGVVCRSREPAEVTLEGEPIRYRRGQLLGRLALCGRLVAATGKPALAAPPSFSLAAAVIGYHDDGESLLSEWSRVRQEPLSRLAAWLCPNKELSSLAYPTGTSVAAMP